MEYLRQIGTYPSLLLGPAFAAAVVSGVVAILVGWLNRKATSDDVNRRIDSERAITDKKLAHEREQALTDRAWLDYGLRRDIYLDFAAQIGCLFEGEPSPTTTEAAAARMVKRTFIETCRKVRLIGSDEVVKALNELTASIKARQHHDITERNYAKLMNAIRRDIRTLNEKPPAGTALDESAFPIES